MPVFESSWMRKSRRKRKAC